MSGAMTSVYKKASDTHTFLQKPEASKEIADNMSSGLNSLGQKSNEFYNKAGKATKDGLDSAAEGAKNGFNFMQRKMNETGVT